MSATILCPSCGHDAFGHSINSRVEGVWVLVCQHNNCRCLNTPAECAEKFLEQDRASVRRAALLEAAKAVCNNCGIGLKISECMNKTFIHYTSGGDFYECRASPIRALLAQEQAQGGGAGNDSFWVQCQFEL